MAHQIYLTEGIILKEKDFGEADRLFWIYTDKSPNDTTLRQRRSAGKIKTSRQFGYFYLWRFCRHFFQRFLEAGGRAGDNFIGAIIKVQLEAIKIFAKLASLMIRMIKGEEKNRELGIF